MFKDKDEKRFIKVFREGSLTESIEVLLDTETGVNYLYISAGYGMGITPLLDGEGKVVVSRKREIENYKERDWKILLFVCFFIGYENNRKSLYYSKGVYYENYFQKTYEIELSVYFNVRLCKRFCKWK